MNRTLGCPVNCSKQARHMWLESLFCKSSFPGDFLSLATIGAKSSRNELVRQ